MNVYRLQTRARGAGFVLIIGCLTPTANLCSQGYYNTDAGRPVRVEDATPTPRYELELQLTAPRVDVLASGTRRWRNDFNVSYGIAPFTEVELGAPLIVLDPHTAGSTPRSGLGGVSLGLSREWEIETGSRPAIAATGSFVAPVGSLAAHTGSYSAKLIATKTFASFRVHANAGVGTWAVRRDDAAASCAQLTAPGAEPPPGCGQAYVPDTPCDEAPLREPLSANERGGAVRTPPAVLSTRESAAIAGQASAPPATTGARWLAGLGIDHALALRSTLLMADIVAERFAGLYGPVDLSSELGVRYQHSPQSVLDMGLTRHFIGPVRSNGVTIGVTYGVPLQLRRVGEPAP